RSRPAYCPKEDGLRSKCRRLEFATFGSRLRRPARPGRATPPQVQARLSWPKRETELRPCQGGLRGVLDVGFRQNRLRKPDGTIERLERGDLLAGGNALFFESSRRYQHAALQ